MDLPHYKLDNQLQKNNLFEYCINDDIIKDYLPDNCNSEGITRELLLSVRAFYFYIVHLSFSKGLF